MGSLEASLWWSTAAVGCQADNSTEDRIIARMDTGLTATVRYGETRTARETDTDKQTETDMEVGREREPTWRLI